MNKYDALQTKQEILETLLLVIMVIMDRRLVIIMYTSVLPVKNGASL